MHSETITPKPENYRFGESFDVKKIAAEVRRIYPLARQAAAKRR
jgi:hypothetical protein